MLKSHASSDAARRGPGVLQTAKVEANRPVCREHFRLTLRAAALPEVRPGQFVHLSPVRDEEATLMWWDDGAGAAPALDAWRRTFEEPMLRRAFSAAAVCRGPDGVRVDVIHRVVGKATRWMAALAPGDGVSMLGPLGNAFPIRGEKPLAWMIGGGVGVPPMLMLAEALREAGRQSTALCGAQAGDLFCFGLDAAHPPDPRAEQARPSAVEFAACGIPAILSTDDGSLGFRGHIGAALTAFHRANPIAANELVVYACGPERMLEFVARYCLERDIECYLCMERAMACGMGTCQSCALPVRDEQAEGGWRYQLCCTDGPIFDAARVIF